MPHKDRAARLAYWRDYNKQGRRDPAAMAERMKRYRGSDHYRLRAAAYQRLLRAVRSGRVTRTACPCGATETQAHHPRGYEGANALDVEWLCLIHHRAAHGR